MGTSFLVSFAFSFAIIFMSQVKSLSPIRLFVTPWTVAFQVPPFIGFSRQEYWSGLPFPSSGDLPNPGVEHGSPALQADSLPSEPPGKTLSSSPPPQFGRRSSNREGTQPSPLTENWIKDLLNVVLPLRTRASFPLYLSHQEAFISFLSLSIRGQTE